MKSQNIEMMLAAALLWIGTIVQADMKSYHVVLQGMGTDTPTQNPIGKLTYMFHTAPKDTVQTSSSCATTLTTSNNLGSSNTIEEANIPQSCGATLLPKTTGIYSSAIKAVATKDFSLSVFFAFLNSGSVHYEGYQAIPDDALGEEYFVVTYCTMGGVCQFSVTAIKDGTSVRVLFPKTVRTTDVISCLSSTQQFVAGTEVPITLNEMDVLHIESSDDLTGTYIIANEPIAVYAGSRNVPSIQGSGYMFEQMIPVPRWGTHHFVLPNVLNQAGDLIKIVTMAKATSVKISGFSPFVIPDMGDSIVRRIDYTAYSEIETNYPVLIAQLSSVDLYNDTGAITGTPSMLLLQTMEHWADSKYAVCPTTDAQNRFGFITKEASTSTLTIVDQNGAAVTPIASAWNFFPGAGNSEAKHNIHHLTSTIRFVKTSSAEAGVYAFCHKGGIYTAGMKLETETKGCVKTVSLPGDGVDNDCDGQIDSVTCTDADRRINFISTPNINGSVNYLELDPTGTEYLTFSLQTCGVAYITFFSTENERYYINVAFLYSQVVTVTVCSPECTTTRSTIDPSNYCTGPRVIQLRWFTHAANDSTRDLQVYEDRNSLIPLSPAIPIVKMDYNRMTFTSMVALANFTIELMQKDCAKIPSIGLDSMGNTFIIPVKSGEDFNVFFTTNTGTYTVTTIDAFTLSNKPMTDPLSQATFGSATFEWFTLYTSEETVIYLGRSTDGMHIAPVDVLGPTYSFYAVPNTNQACKMYPVGTQVTIVEPNQKTITAYNGDYDYMNTLLRPADNYVHAQHPFAMFCQQTGGWLQMPPIESLGQKDTPYYIPALQFTDAKISTAKMYVTTTEDSTYLQVSGNYHEETTKDNRGETYTRAVVNNQVYTIKASKAVLVILEVVSSADTSKMTSVVIPPSTQYQIHHRYPSGLFSTTQPLGSFSVSASGTTVPSTVAKQGAAQTVTYPAPTFTISVTDGLGSPSGQLRLLLSDVKYKHSNTKCRLTDSTLNDTKDNDCDGLEDEEVCVSLLPGDVDSDIDGNINEDCETASAAYTVAGNAMSLNLTTSVVSCVVTTPTPPITTIAAPTVPSGPGTIVTPPVTPALSAPVLAPIVVTAGVVQVPTTTPPPGSTAPPVPAEETCTTDCLCPCGWVETRNYTTEEIKEAVTEIQEKLKIDKKKLSAAVRKKTSASDDRTSATAVGYAGLSFLVVSIGSIVLLDFTTISRDLRMLRDNMRQMFQM